MKKLFFVMNPYAGLRKANKLLVDILNVFNRAGYDVTVYITAATGDGKRAVVSRAKEFDLIVCCGGDGTFNEVVAGILESGAQVPVGYIPAGSTNDFASSLGLSSDILQAASDIATGVPESFDMGSFGGRYFSYVASFGAFTRASYSTPQSMKNALGHAAYLLSGIQELSQLKPVHLTFTLPDGSCIEGDWLFGAISNSTSMGGILTLSARVVDMRDGKFELLLIRAPKDLLELSDCIRALQRQTYDCDMITLLSTPSLTVTAPGDMPWTLDGEREDPHEKVEVENLHHAIRVIRRNQP